MFSIRWASQVKSFKLHRVSDLENTTTATWGTVLISWKARGNTSHVIIMSIVCVCGPWRLCWLACVGGDKEERFFSQMYSCMETLNGSDAEGHQGHTPCVYTQIREWVHTRTPVRTHKRLRVLSLVGHAGGKKNMLRPWSFHGCHCTCAFTWTSMNGLIFRDTHRGTPQLIHTC